MQVTVAICTYQRADALRAAMESLAQCDPPGEPWQLLIVDNADEPAVRELVESFKNRLPVTYVAESKTGVSHARNRALAECTTPVVVFADDDVTFDHAWLRRMADAIAQHDECDFWGGRVKPVWLTDQPAWFAPDRCPMLLDMIVHYDGGDEPRAWDRQTLKPFFCANLAMRVDAAQAVGGFDTGAGHFGQRRGAGEDGFMVDALVSRGGRGWYVGDAVVHHPVPPERVTRRFARRFAWRQGWVSAETHRRLEGGDAQRLPRWWYRVAIEQGCRSFGRWIAGLLRFDSAAAFAGEFGMRYNLSRFWHALRRREQCPE